MHPKQIEIVEFAEKIYHSGLRHSGTNGTLYEYFLIHILREELPNLEFYSGQIKGDSISSPHYDIIICRKNTPQLDYIKQVNSFVNIVDKESCLGVIELKKWAHPKMISKNGPIESAYRNFKTLYPTLKYFFVAYRFKDRMKADTKNWHHLKEDLEVDGKFCFFGRSNHFDKEWQTPWSEQLIQKQLGYDGEFEKLINVIGTLG